MTSNEPKHPLLEVLDQKQEELQAEHQLHKKKRPTNRLVLATAILLALSVLVGLIRTLLVIFH